MGRTSLLAGVALAVTTLSSSMAAHAAPDPTAHALQYLAGQQAADGSIGGSLSATANYALGARAAGVDPTTLKSSSNKSVYDWLSAWLAGANATCQTASPGKNQDGNSIGTVVQAVVAGGLDPTAFSGRNLLAGLEGPGAAAGGLYDPATGAFLDCGGGVNQAYAQANAILALVGAANPTYPVTDKALTYLRGLQDKTSDAPGGRAPGGWQVFGQDNTNATALALMALASRESPCDDAATFVAAFDFLKTQQDPATGGFEYSTLGDNVNAFPSSASDPDSDALVIQALTASAQDPGGAAWSNPHGSAASDVLTFQDQPSGGFVYDHAPASKPTAFTTAQVPAGLKRAPFPITSATRTAPTCPAGFGPTQAAVAPAPSPAPRLPGAGAVPGPGADVEGPALVLVVGLAAVAHLSARGRRRMG